MKRQLITFISAMIFNFVMAEPLTPESVNVFYGGMVQLVNARDNNQAEFLESKMRECFFDYENSGPNLPNDFKFFDHDKKSTSHSDEKLSSRIYIIKLSDYLYKDKVMKISYEVVKNEISGSAPTFQAKRLSNEDSYISTIIKKTYIIRGISHSFNDTVYTHINSGLIGGICNGFGINSIDIESLKIKAARAYYRKDFNEAYKCYEQILEIDKTDKETLYRLGLMTYWKQGCEHKFGKARYARRKAIEYMEAADRLGYPSAEQVLFYWKYPRQ